jgi:hypothetical protein
MLTVRDLRPWRYAVEADDRKPGAFTSADLGPDEPAR